MIPGCKARPSIFQLVKALNSTWACTPNEINAGDCAIWACAFRELLGEGTIYVGLGVDDKGSDSEFRNGGWDHVFVRCRGKFYDAETPRGVSHPSHLPIYKRCNDPMRYRKFDIRKTIFEHEKVSAEESVRAASRILLAKTRTTPSSQARSCRRR